MKRRIIAIKIHVIITAMIFADVIMCYPLHDINTTLSDLDVGLVAYWPLTDYFGTRDATHNAIDGVATSVSLSPVRGPVQQNPNGALQIKSTDDYFNFTSPLFSKIWTSSSWSIAMFVNGVGGSNNISLLEIPSSTTLLYSSGTISLLDQGVVITSGKCQLNDGWQFVGVVRYFSRGTVQLFCNDAFVNNVTNFPMSPSVSGPSLILGHSSITQSGTANFACASVFSGHINDTGMLQVKALCQQFQDFKCPPHCLSTTCRFFRRSPFGFSCTCKPPWWGAYCNIIPSNNTKYYMFQERKTREAAAASCSLYGHVLASIRSQSEQDAVATLASFAEPGSDDGLGLWIGGQADVNNAPFYWTSDNATFNYTNWGLVDGRWQQPDYQLNHPNQNAPFCTRMLNNGVWDDISCNGNNTAEGGICEKKKVVKRTNQTAIISFNTTKTAVTKAMQYQPPLPESAPQTNLTAQHVVGQCSEVSPLNRSPSPTILKQDIPIQVNLKFSIDRFIGINDIQQSVSAIGELYAKWSVLTCPVIMAGGNSARVRVRNIDDIWHPALIFRNAMDDISMRKGQFSDDLEFVYLANSSLSGDDKHSGIHFYWKKRGLFNGSCGLNLDRYPFDSQSCDFTFTMEESNRLTVFAGIGFSVQSLEQNGQQQSPADPWVIVSGESRSNVIPSIDSSVDQVSEVSFTLVVKRRPDYVVFNLLGPCLVLTFLSFTTFLIPSQNSDRACFNVYLLLALFVSEKQVSSNTPQTPQNILLGQYIELLEAVSLFITTHSIAMLFLTCNYKQTASRLLCAGRLKLDHFCNMAGILTAFAALSGITYFFLSKANVF